jgi:hypothetical protein
MSLLSLKKFARQPSCTAHQFQQDSKIVGDLVMRNYQTHVLLSLHSDASGCNIQAWPNHPCVYLKKKVDTIAMQGCHPIKAAASFTTAQTNQCQSKLAHASPGQINACSTGAPNMVCDVCAVDSNLRLPNTLAANC